MPTDSTERFSTRVENYVKYRPDYPKEIISFLAEKTGLSKNSVIADIGSGTGISTRLFLENGGTVYGVEPNLAMREAAEKYLSEFPNFKSIDGTAEDTNLPDKSVDYITAAQAFHWFDQQKTLREFRRILKGGGFLAFIWNERRLDSTPFLLEYERFLLRYGTDYNLIRHDQITREVLEECFQTDLAEEVFPNAQALDLDGLKGRISSASYIPSPEHPRYEAMIGELQELFIKHQEKGKITILYDTKVFYGQF